MDRIASTDIEQLELTAWQTFLRAHCSLSNLMDRHLRERHGLTLSDYDVLVQLAGASDMKLRMSELAERVLLTRSGITRLVDGLTRDGHVQRVSCDVDARVAYAQLTDRGLALLAEARATHRTQIDEVFGQHYSASELEQLNELLSRLPISDDPPCCASDS